MNDVELLGQAMIKKYETEQCKVLFSGNAKFGNEIELSERITQKNYYRRLIFTFRTSNAGTFYSVEVGEGTEKFKISMIDIDTVENNRTGIDYITAKIKKKDLMTRTAYEFTNIKRIKADGTILADTKETNFKCITVTGYR